MELGLRKWGNHLGLQIPHQLAVNWGLDETSVEFVEQVVSVLKLIID